MVRSFFRKKWILFVLILIAASAAVFWFFRRTQNGLATVRVVRGSLAEEVMVTGKTTPLESVELSFQQTGRVLRVLRDAGDRVSVGELLAELDRATKFAELKQAEADGRAARARLAELKLGTRPEEIQVQEVKVRSAASALEDAKRGLIDKLQDSYTRSDDAVRGSVDVFFTNPRSANPQLNFQIGDSRLQQDVLASRVAAEQLLAVWREWLVDGPALASDDALDGTYHETVQNLTRVKSFLDKASLAINSTSASSFVSQTTLDSWRAAVSAARTSINTAMTNLSSAYEKLRGARSTLALEESQLALKNAGVLPETIAAQEAAVAEAEAKILSIQTQLDQMTLFAPLAGVVTKMDAKPGEVVAASRIIAVIISQDQLQVESNVPEVDIGRVKIGNLVSISLDAFPGEIFDGRIIYIDPAETVVEGVVNYKVKIFFNGHDPRFKSGLTANLRIRTLERSDILIIPQSAVIERGGKAFVRIKEDEGTREVLVVTGMRGGDGRIEIASGVGEGQEVVSVNTQIP